MTGFARRPATVRERMALGLYSLLWLLATPLVAAYLLWRARRQPAYRRFWSQRFLGLSGPSRASGSIWIHAVSVGETRAAAPLVHALIEAHPDVDVVVTHMTPTGRETAESLFGDRVRHAYLAYDYPHAVATFLRRWRPALGIVMETEIWPNLMKAAARREVPMLLANARLSPKSLVGARRWPSLMRPAVRGFSRILAQTDADAKRFAILAESEDEPASSAAIAVVGNVKFDIEPPAAQRALADAFRQGFALQADGGARRVFLFASTREGEEEQILDAWLRHREDGPRALLVVVPRHPQRFDQVFEQARSRGIVVQRRSAAGTVDAATDVWLGDSMGELWAYYLAADLAYVGGSIPPLGGQNLIEAAAAACPILIGRNTFNFAAASDEAVRVGAAKRVSDYDALIIEGLKLAHDAARRRAMGQAGTGFAASHRGATARTVAVVEEFLRANGAKEKISRP